MIERLLAGEAAFERNELDVAERLFSQVATADPRNAIALVGLARIAVRQGDVDAARALATRALAIDPDEAAAMRLLADLDSTSMALEPAPADRGRPAGAFGPPAVEPAPNPPIAAQAPPRRARSGWRSWLDRLLRRR